MPYCPKCDMEFVEGITRCSDCGGVLVESKEAADALAEAERKEQEAIIRSRYEAAIAAAAEMKQALEAEAADQKRTAPVRAYVNKEQRYEDMNSSSTAFFLVGTLTAVFAVLTLTGIVSLPMHAVSRWIFQGMLVVMSIGSFIVAISSRKSAGILKTEAADEEKETEEIVQWFVNTYSGKDLDQQILSEEPDLSEEEISLRRFDMIQDYLITGRDLPDQSYVDALCDMIYSRLYENES